MKCLDFALWIIGQCVSNANSIALDEKTDGPLMDYGILKKKDIAAGPGSWVSKKFFHALLPYWDPSKLKKEDK